MSLNYKGQNLFVDNTSVKGIAKNNITPFYVYSYKKIKNNFESFASYFRRINPLICFSVKSNSNVSLKNVKSITLFIGPEGDFSEKEVNFAVNHGIIPVELSYLEN